MFHHNRALRGHGWILMNHLWEEEKLTDTSYSPKVPDAPLFRGSGQHQDLPPARSRSRSLASPQTHHPG